MLNQQPLEQLDPEIYSLIQAERTRQENHLELIASENVTPPAIDEAVGSVLTNKYAEGYPGKRYYGGCIHVDGIEERARERAKALFGAEHANVQPHSGSQANEAVYLATVKPGDTILTMSLMHGGHLTHGHPKNSSGMRYQVVHYGVNEQSGLIDYADLEAKAKAHQPKLISIGASAYPQKIDFERVATIARGVGAYLWADVAHIAGLIAAGLHPSPIPHADFVTTTTHKTLRGPRGGLILCKQAHAKAIDSAVFPGIQGGPLMHVIAGKAVCFKEAQKDSFRAYQQQILLNAKALAQGFLKKGYSVVSGGTENHLILLDLRSQMPDLTGKEAQERLDQAHITCNRNTIPGDTRSPFQTSGLRIGTPAVTTRGMTEAEMLQIVDWMDLILKADPSDLAAVIERIRSQVIALCDRFPLHHGA